MAKSEAELLDELYISAVQRNRDYARRIQQLRERLSEDSRLLSGYARLERDRGNTAQADAIERHRESIAALLKGE